MIAPSRAVVAIFGRVWVRDGFSLEDGRVSPNEVPRRGLVVEGCQKTRALLQQIIHRAPQTARAAVHRLRI